MRSIYISGKKWGKRKMVKTRSVMRSIVRWLGVTSNRVLTTNMVKWPELAVSFFFFFFIQILLSPCPRILVCEGRGSIPLHILQSKVIQFMVIQLGTKKQKQIINMRKKKVNFPRFREKKYINLLNYQ